MSLSPPLLSMFKDSLLQQRYLKKIENLIELAEKEVERTRWLPQFHEVALCIWTFSLLSLFFCGKIPL